MNQSMHIHQFSSEIWLAAPIKEVFRLFFGHSQSRFDYTAMAEFSDRHAPPIEMHTGAVIYFAAPPSGKTADAQPVITAWEPS